MEKMIILDLDVMWITTWDRKSDPIWTYIPSGNDNKKNNRISILQGVPYLPMTLYEIKKIYKSV